MSRAYQVMLIAATVLSSWLGMKAVHELGHVLGAWATGASVTHVVLHPLAISRTDIANNTRPLVVVWAGPVVGALMPLVIWLAAVTLRFQFAFLFKFFAGFCLVANGLYVGIGSFARVGDCGDMLRHGSALWQLWLFGLLTAPVGLWMWHGLGRQFGLGAGALAISPRAIYVALAICAVLLAIGLSIGK